MKKVLLIVIDALSSRIVNPALDTNRLPNLRRLRDAATLQADSIAIFPSITPAATSALVTGCYPQQHGISGAYWYIPEQKEVIYFGYDIWAILEEGPGTFLKDFLIALNEEHLQAETLFHHVEQAGLTAACLNYIIYHGDYAHLMKIPGLLQLLPNTPGEATVNGPSLLYFGDAIKTPLHSGQILSAPGGVFNRFGFTDETTAELLRQLVRERALPDFTLAYFPENDVHSHEVGPAAALRHLEQVDESLGQIFGEFGGLTQMLSEVCVVLTGDHSQSDVVGTSLNPGIRLDQLLESFAVADAGTPMATEDDLVVCPNLRTAQSYFHTPTPARFERVIECLLLDERIDQVMWSAGLLQAGEKGYHVVTRNRGNLHFWAGSDGPQSAEDVYGNVWSWEGDLQVVDGQMKEKTITFGNYPNAFERLAGVLDLSITGHLWVTSRPGYEFCLANTTIHAGGGSHGSLHILDSLSPLWVAGAPHAFSLPRRLRTVDVVPLCLSVLGLQAGQQPGTGRIATAT